jgi:N-acyl-phosphatidylethanolamine-hydrolysing phospholipase D
MKKTFIILFFTSLSFFSGCMVFQEIAGNTPTIFKSPEEVQNKIKNPVLDNARLAVLWIGHSSCLIQMDDKQILVDPVLTQTIGILSKRLIEPGTEIGNIPKLDLVSITHSHIDHLSIGSIEELLPKNKGVPLVFPDGLESFLPGNDFNYIQMNNSNGYADGNPIADSVTVNGITVYTVTAKHWGGRYGIDGFLWGDHSYTSFIYENNGLTVFFGGDTGYDSLAFKKIGERFNIDLALIPIGPCEECEGIGNKRHAYPEGAIKIFLDLNAKVLMPIHYGVFQFRLADVNDPLYKFEDLVKLYNIESKTQILKIGEQKTFIFR